MLNDALGAQWPFSGSENHVPVSLLSTHWPPFSFTPTRTHVCSERRPQACPDRESVYDRQTALKTPQISPNLIEISISFKLSRLGSLDAWFESGLGVSRHREKPTAFFSSQMAELSKKNSFVDLHALKSVNKHLDTLRPLPLR